MVIEQRQWTEGDGWVVTQATDGDGAADFRADLVLFFGAQPALGEATAFLRAQYPDARLLGCSTAGEICGITVLDGSVVATAMQFEHTRIHTTYRALTDAQGSASVGESIARELSQTDLVHVFVLAEGLHVNGSELVKGLRAALPTQVAVTGGLAGDGERFLHTQVRLDERVDDSGVAAVGFYGQRLRIGYGSMGGWDQFGPERLVTRSVGNVLYELDGSSALALYKNYLGAYAADLPASGLLFPLSIRGSEGDAGVVRTILGIDEAEGSLTFAGDIPEGAYTRLMKANVDRLIDGAHGAAGVSYQAIGHAAPQLAVLISCVGRKLVLKQRIEEEVESVREVLGTGAVLSGFYSYGEIAPFNASVKCELHNQTMTITTFSEE